MVILGTWMLFDGQPIEAMLCLTLALRCEPQRKWLRTQSSERSTTDRIKQASDILAGWLLIAGATYFMARVGIG